MVYKFTVVSFGLSYDDSKDKTINEIKFFFFFTFFSKVVIFEARKVNVINDRQR